MPRLQARVWMDGPRQVLLVTSQERPLCWVPDPQVAEHSVHSAHGDQPSSPSAQGHHCLSGPRGQDTGGAALQSEQTPWVDVGGGQTRPSGGRSAGVDPKKGKGAYEELAQTPSGPWQEGAHGRP